MVLHKVESGQIQEKKIKQEMLTPEHQPDSYLLRTKFGNFEVSGPKIPELHPIISPYNSEPEMSNSEEMISTPEEMISTPEEISPGVPVITNSSIYNGSNNSYIINTSSKPQVIISNNNKTCKVSRKPFANYNFTSSSYNGVHSKEPDKEVVHLEEEEDAGSLVVEDGIVHIINNGEEGNTEVVAGNRTNLTLLSEVASLHQVTSFVQPGQKGVKVESDRDTEVIPDHVRQSHVQG